MSSISLKDLGISKQQLIEKIVERASDALVYGTKLEYDDDGDPITPATEIRLGVEARYQEAIDAAVNEIAEKHVFPSFAKHIEGVMLQQTNKWGEKKGEPVSFIEYLTERAEAYMQEAVDFSGKTKSEASGFSWSGKQTRLVYLVNTRLQYSIESAVKSALKDMNSNLSKALAETVKTQLETAVANLNISAQVK